MDFKFSKGTVNTDETKIDELLTRGVAEVIDAKDLRKKLLSGKKLRIKLGIDPTSPNIHIGRAVILWKLRAFQDLGHTAIFIIGDHTGVVGDTSDKESERPMLTKKEVESNMRTYLDQAFRILDRKKTEKYYNSKWLKKLGLIELARIANLFSLKEFTARDIIARRLVAGQSVSLNELMYPMMQGYDSVMVRADVELGGTDQRFNLLTGRKIQPHYNQAPQDIIMMEILEGTDGRKMSSSWGNTINIGDTPNDMFGKIMSLNDNLILKYFELATLVSREAINEYKKKLDGGENPKKIKMALATEIVRMYHGDEEALKAEENFEKVFSKKEIPEEIKEIYSSAPKPMGEVLVENGIISSKSEFRRLEIKDAVTGQPISEGYNFNDTITLKLGKKRGFIKIIKK